MGINDLVLNLWNFVGSVSSWHHLKLRLNYCHFSLLSWGASDEGHLWNPKSLFWEKKLFPEKLTESLPVRLKGKYCLYLRSGAVPLPWLLHPLPSTFPTIATKSLSFPRVIVKALLIPRLPNWAKNWGVLGGGQMPLPRTISSGLGKYHRGYFAQDCPPPRQRLLCLLINPVTSSSVHCLVETSGLAIIDLKCLRLPHPKPLPDGQAILACSNIQNIFFDHSTNYFFPPSIVSILPS
jgi:hypothetical protein